MKAGMRFPDGWELYDMEADRTKLHDLASKEAVRLKRMADMCENWAKIVGVQTWPMPETPKGEASGDMPTPPYMCD